MRQRNNTIYPITVPSIPVEVEPGDVIDYPELLMGFESIDPPAGPAVQPAAKSKRTPVSEAPTTPAVPAPAAATVKE